VDKRDEEAAEQKPEGVLEEETSGRMGELTRAVIGAAIEVHRSLGPGFLEAFYEQALCVEFALRGIPFFRQAAVLVQYKGTPIGEARYDLLVDRCLLVELKACERLAPLHVAQVLSYLKATGLTVGLLINFNVPFLREGIRRIVHTADQRRAAADWIGENGQRK
jgi:GxxExxY protein